MEIDDDAKSVSHTGDDGHWYIQYDSIFTMEGACGILSMMLYRIANDIQTKNMDSPEEILERVERGTWRI